MLLKLIKLCERMGSRRARCATVTFQVLGAKPVSNPGSKIKRFNHRFMYLLICRPAVPYLCLLICRPAVAAVARRVFGFSRACGRGCFHDHSRPCAATCRVRLACTTITATHAQLLAACVWPAPRSQPPMRSYLQSVSGLLRLCCHLMCNCCTFSMVGAQLLHLWQQCNCCSGRARGCVKGCTYVRTRIVSCNPHPWQYLLFVLAVSDFSN